MTTENLFATTRVPDVIRDLPNFDGNPNHLYGFINRIDTIIKVIPNVSDSALNFVTLNAIRSKIIDQASEYLDEQGTTLDWSSIKSNLLLRYADKRDEMTLVRDLNRLTQNGNTIENFYSKINEMKVKLTNYVKNNELDEKLANSKISFYAELCLNAFLKGIHGPLGGNVYCMQPKTLEEAYKICNEIHENYYSNNFNKYNRNNYSNNNYNNRNPNTNYNNYNPNRSNGSFNNNYNPNRNSNHNNRYFNSNQYDHPLNRNYKYNDNQSGSHQQPQNFNSNRNRYREMEPMDTSSGNTRINSASTRISSGNTRLNNNDKRYRIQNQNRPNFVSEELFNMDNENNNDNVTVEIENENFREKSLCQPIGFIDINN